jgi:hypothetical protein
MLLPTYPFLIKNYRLHYNLNKVNQSKLIHNLMKDLSRLLWLETFSLQNIQDFFKKLFPYEVKESQLKLALSDVQI